MMNLLFIFLISMVCCTRHRKYALHDFGPKVELADDPFTQFNFTQKLDHFGNNTKTF